MKNILELLEKQAKTQPNKTFLIDENRSVSYSKLLSDTLSIASFFAQKKIYSRAIAIFCDQAVEIPICMFGIIGSGNYYCVLDVKSPTDRLNAIIDTLNPAAIITDIQHYDSAQVIFDIPIFCIENVIKTEINKNELDIIRNKQIDTDPIYVLFTSGSTGNPKGTVINHLNVLKYSKWLVDTFDYNENTVLGNQSPFYFSMSVSDIYGALRSGGTICIIPKKLFSFPLVLLKYLNEKEINTIYWVPSALSIVANWKALDYVELKSLKKILFAGEVMPTKQLNYWIERMGKDVLFANLFGPTETTDICCYYKINRQLSDDESVPIGVNCDNSDCIIIKDDGTRALQGESGELMVRGSFVAGGYINNPEQTKKAFVQNPLNKLYPEIVYKTGDVVKLNEYGEMIYLSRKDYQIKHLGYRIELGEIEAAVNSIDRIDYCACIYDKDEDKIILIYQGKRINNDYVLKFISNKLPSYMMPNEMIDIENMLFNSNGKIDRKNLANLWKKGELK